MIADPPHSLLIPPPTPTGTRVHAHRHSDPPLLRLRPPPPLPAPLHVVIHGVPKPAALLKPRKSWAWPGFKQQCSWDLLHFRQTALSVSLAINSPCGCLPLPRKGFFFFFLGSGKTHRLITVGSKASFVSAAQGQRASRCCCFNALIVAGSSRRHSCGCGGGGGWC